MIEVDNITKKYKDQTVVDSLSFTVETGKITGFLGPNGAGKSTTMRMMLGLDTPTSGTSHIDGSTYHQLDSPLTHVGALLDASSVHPARTAYSHLHALCAGSGIPTSRIGECLSLVGLSDVANKKAGKFSLGMRQRLGIAGALLGDPEYLILDEPVNGLDPEGIRWVRNFLTALAQEGRGVFVSSHQLGELSKMSHDLVVIGQGKMIYSGSTHDFITENSTSATTLVHTSNDQKLAEHLQENTVQYTQSQTTPGLVVNMTDTKTLGDMVLSLGLSTYIMSQDSGLEDAFITATYDSAQHTTRNVDADTHGKVV